MNGEQHQLTTLIKRARTLAHIGLQYGASDYDLDRYSQLKEIADQMLQLVTNETIEKITGYFSTAKEYITPKVDIRAVVFNEQRQILLVKEKEDGLWSLPGGWADIGLTPNEVAVNEVKEETGLLVIPLKLLAVLDKKCHPHPPQPDYVYKFFIQCGVNGGDFKKVFDILDAGFFDKGALPPLSLKRVLPEQIELMFDYLDDPNKLAIVD